jgi:hypothetical protein
MPHSAGPTSLLNLLGLFYFILFSGPRDGFFANSSTSWAPHALNRNDIAGDIYMQGKHGHKEPKKLEGKMDGIASYERFNSSSTFGSTSYKRSGFPAGIRHLSILWPPVAVSLRHPRL